MNFVKSLYHSFKQAFLTNEEVQKFSKRFPRATSFLKKRLDKSQFTGLRATILGVIFLYVLILLAGVVEGFINSEIVVSADSRVNVLLYFFRNVALIKTFIWVTLLGESPTVIVFVAIVVALLWMRHKKWQIISFLVTIVGSEVFTYFGKIFFHRPRPINAVYLESSYSFPSGHATIAVALYGFLAYLLFKKTKKKIYRAAVGFVALIMIGAIGFSRLYLGVHYVSDVWAGYLVGLIWLVVGVGLSELKLYQEKVNSSERIFDFKYHKIIVGALLSFALIFYICFGLLFHPKFLPKPAITPATTVSSATSIFNDYNLTRYTETLNGQAQEPVSFVIAAKDDFSFVADFKKAGWNLSDSINLRSIAELFKYSVSNKEYPTAPMTPSFWNKQVHDFGFEKSTETKSVRQRHHARFWKTNLQTVQGETIYVGTVSLDVGIKWFITHKISPDIDTERDLLFGDLQSAGLVGGFDKMKLVSPILGQNFSGDQFFTNGEAYFLHF